MSERATNVALPSSERLNALKDAECFAASSTTRKDLLLKLLNKSFKLWLDLKVISKSARTREAVAAYANSFSARGLPFDFYIKRN